MRPMKVREVEVIRDENSKEDKESKSVVAME